MKYFLLVCSLYFNIIVLKGSTNFFDIVILNNSNSSFVLSFLDEYGILISETVKPKDSVTIKKIKPMLISFSHDFNFYPFLINGNQRRISIENIINNKIFFADIESNELVNQLADLYENEPLNLLLRSTFGRDWSYKANLSFFIKKTDETYKKQLSMINNLGLDSVSARYLCNNARHIYLIDLLAPIYDSSLNKDTLFLIHPNYIKKLDSLKKEIESIVTLEYTYRHDKKIAYEYNNYLCLNTTQKVDFPILWASAKVNFITETKEYLLFRLLKEYIYKLPNYTFYRKEFDNLSINNNYKIFLDSIEKNNALEFQEVHLNTPLKNIDTALLIWKNILNENKGKIIYLDFWATWCNPCLKEMSYYSELVKQIPHDDIVFLFISIDSDNDVDKWKERIGSLILPSFSQHYLMNRTSELGTLLNLSSIPRYILIDKNGKIVSFDAPRPSNINEFLNVIKYIRSSSK